MVPQETPEPQAQGSARDALVAYAAGARSVTADGLAPYLDRFAVEAVAAAAPPPLDAAREAELRAELHGLLADALSNAHRTHPCPATGSEYWTGCYHPDGTGASCHTDRRVGAVLDKLLPLVLHDARVAGNTGQDMRAADKRIGELEGQLRRARVETWREADAELGAADRRFVRADDPETTAWMRGWDDARAELRRMADAGEPAGPAAVQFASARPDGSVLDDVPATDRAEAEARLARTRHQYPTARLVQRTVSYGPWGDVAEAGER